MQISGTKVPVYGGSVQARGKHPFDVIPVLHRLSRETAEMPSPLELWCLRVPALSAYAYQKDVSSVLAQPDGTVRGAFIADYAGVAKGTELHAVRLHVLVGVLGALRLAELETDHALLEAWLDTAFPDWRERMTGEEQAAPGGVAFDPYDVLGVTPQDDMAAITAAHRRAMKAVHPDTSGGASAWLSRTVADAYKQIRATRAP